MNTEPYITRCFGITKDQGTNNFTIVMQYINGSLRQRLNTDHGSMVWYNKLNVLCDIAKGLGSIHKGGLTHRDLHSGNVLSFISYTCITDLGLCKPANEMSEKCGKSVYGVLPYIAPEVLNGKGYTQASDIYSFGISFMKYLMDYLLTITWLMMKL